MPKKYVPLQKGPYAKHNYDDMEKAVQCVREGKLSVRKAAEKFKIAKSTLGDRVKGKTAINAKSGRNPVIPSEIENNIVETTVKGAERGFGLGRKQMLNRIGSLCKKYKISGFKNGTPSKHVWYSLKSRHPELTLRKPEKLGTVRARMLNEVVVQKYFNDLRKIITELNLTEKPAYIWNCDETGKQLEHTPVRVVAAKGTKNVVGRTSNDRSHITIMACVNAAGGRMPPMVIVKGKTAKSLFGYNTAAAPPNTVWSFQEKAWMNEELCEKWFRNVFLQHCGPQRPQLLILDGHGSHETLALLQLAEQERIHILALPPHTTHFLQPLDRSVFGPFNKAYNSICSDFLSAAAFNVINKWTFPGIFKSAWEQALSPDNIISGFRGCGIYPLNENAIPQCAFLPSTVYDKPLVDSSSSGIPFAAGSPPEAPAVALVDSRSSGIPFATGSLPEVQAVANQETPMLLDLPLVSTDTATSNVKLIHDNDETAAAVASIIDDTITDGNITAVTVDVHSQPITDDNTAVTVDLHNQPILETNVSSQSLVDATSLLEMINAGQVEIVATADEQGVAEIPPVISWSTDMAQMFLPSPSSENVLQPKKAKTSKAITSHRLLTHESVINLKIEAENKKQEKLQKQTKRKENTKVTVKNLCKK